MTEPDFRQRPNPDLLLKAIQRTEEKSDKGRLIVFLGMAAGVGKTFAMLNVAHELKARDIDVVVGLAETHGRKETEMLMEGLEVIPRRAVPYRNVALEEMDLDVILKRHPQVVLIDEAAHSNAPGSRHSKRWNDILEILDAGIDVYTTLNVQHLESLADTVHEITSVTVTETIPDLIIDMADEVILIDLAPEELIKRLKEGKVYSEERAGRAMQHFFRPGNLSALRELSLRLVADRVSRDIHDYQQVHHITDAWKTRHRLMVAVYASPYSETLIRWTRRMASGLDAEWFATYVESDRTLTEDENRLLRKNLSLVEELGGEVVTTVDDDPVRGLIRLARENRVTQLIVGKSRRGFFHNLRHGGSVVQRLLKESGNIDVYIVSGESSDQVSAPVGSINVSQKPVLFTDFIIAIAAPVLIGILGYLLNPIIAYHAVGLVFLLGVVILGLYISRGAVLLSALLCGLAWNFLFIPPFYTFAITAPEDYMMFGMFLAVAGIVGHLTARLRVNEKHLRIRERRMTALYHLTREISSAISMHDVLDTAIENIGTLLEADIAILVKQPSKVLLPHEGNTLILDEKEMSVAEWTALHSRSAGLFTDTLPSAKALYLPLVASHGTVGVMGLKPRRKRPDTPELTALAETFARQLAMGIEREQLNALARHTMLIEESERLYKTMLSSVSHELKTPLSAIEGSASALLDPVVARDDKSVHDLAEEIQAGSRRLSRIVRNLLDMTRLESGVLPVHKEPGDVRDLISTALRYLDKELSDHPLTLRIPDQIPLVSIDYLLIEQAVINIVHNAAVHTPPGTPVEITVSLEKEFLIINIRDNGPGLPPDNPEIVLEKFWRADPLKAGGSGLGLAIARGWIETHEGKLEARNHPEGGAEFIIRLPLEVHKNE
ncbi:MAG: sensor histidine kinase KdpD [bacterium]|nr:sensor histidine kinase KdpD [bacterium]